MMLNVHSCLSAYVHECCCYHDSSFTMYRLDVLLNAYDVCVRCSLTIRLFDSVLMTMVDFECMYMSVYECVLMCLVYRCLYNT